MVFAQFRSALKRRVFGWRHNRVIRQILQTPPIVPKDDGLILFSMIGTAVVLPYLVAVKSLHAQLLRGRVMLLDDGTLTPADKAILAHHIGNPVIVSLSDIDTAPCPGGNCWERLLSILDLRADHYVIQLDSDTVTLGPVPEVVDAIATNRSFTLGGGVEEQQLGFMTVPGMIASIYPEGPGTAHIQPLIEAKLGEMPGADALRYIRGCAGFAGFARSANGRDIAERFADFGRHSIGPRFTEWGSEQAASNFVIANDPDPVQLPYHRYTNHWAEDLPPRPAFIHYIGTYRYGKGSYRASSLQVIRQLQRNDAMVRER
jgi:hypothetical protein